MSKTDNMYFEDRDGYPVVFDSPGAGRFSLAEAVKHFNCSEEMLIKLHNKFIEPEPESKPKLPAASPARVRALISTLMELHARAILLTTDLDIAMTEIASLERTHEICANEVYNSVERAFDHGGNMFGDIWDAIGDLQRHIALMQSGKMVRAA
ncbi:MAG TPA: hypothetical protein VGG19_20690 [Tepidisphaeraceae bacterium]|jgi:hypothetical protein